MEMHSYVKKFTLQGYFLIFFLFCLLSIFSKLLLGIFYGETTSNYYYILILIAGIQLISYFQFPLSYALRTLGNTKIIFIALSISSFIAITASKFVIAKFNLVGFFCGLFFNPGCTSGCSILGIFVYV